MREEVTYQGDVVTYGGDIVTTLEDTGMARPVIIENSDDEVLIRSTQKFFQPVNARRGPIGPLYDGKYVCFAAVVTDQEITEAQMDSLETQIEAIAGVFRSFVLVGSSRVPYDRLPEDPGFVTELQLGLTAGFDMLATPVEP